MIRTRQITFTTYPILIFEYSNMQIFVSIEWMHLFILLALVSTLPILWWMPQFAILEQGFLYSSKSLSLKVILFPFSQDPNTPHNKSEWLEISCYVHQKATIYPPLLRICCTFLLALLLVKLFWTNKQFWIFRYPPKRLFLFHAIQNRRKEIHLAYLTNILMDLKLWSKTQNSSSFIRLTRYFEIKSVKSERMVINLFLSILPNSIRNNSISK